LSLLELSLDTDLVGNALQLKLDSSVVDFLGAEVHELGNEQVIVVFSTALVAYRLVLPHPEAIARVRTCSSIHMLLVHVYYMCISPHIFVLYCLSRTQP